jgi:hypothetical protein
MSEILVAADLPEILNRFGKAYALETEYRPRPGLPEGPVEPVALQAYEVHSGEWKSLFCEDPNLPLDNPLDPDALYLTFMAAAEWSFFLAVGWTLPRNCVDFYIEFKNQISGLMPPPRFCQPKQRDKWRSSLLSVVQWCGLTARDPREKEAVRAVILRGHPFSREERELILDYCRDDVVDTLRIAKVMLPAIGNLPQAIFRGHFMRAVAKISRDGIPVDAALYGDLLEHRNALKTEIVSPLVGTAMNIYDDGVMRYSKLEELVHSLRLENDWPKPKRKRSKKRMETETSRPHSRRVFSTEADSFEAMAALRPELAPLASVVKQLKDLKAFGLLVGADGRSRFSLFPFDTVTGRCSPPSKRFLFAQSSWTRGFIAPPRGWAHAYLDYSAAEVLIAAVLFGDPELLADYVNGDPYTNCAIRMGLAPEGSTKQTIGQLRDVMKVWLLSTLYGASPKSLHEKLPGSTLGQAEEFVRQNRRSYVRYWNWSDFRTEIFMYETGVEETVFGWQHHLDPSERYDDRLFSFARNRSRNFPMQGKLRRNSAVGVCARM